jgi:hypothetical protein
MNLDLDESGDSKRATLALALCLQAAGQRLEGRTSSQANSKLIPSI